MADYCKASLKIVYSENSDFTDAEADTENWDAYELASPTKVEERKLLATSAGAVTIATGTYTTIPLLAIKNLDVTNYITAIYRTAGGAATNQTVRIPAGGLLVLSDVTPGTSPTVQGNAADCYCKVFIAGT